MLPRIIEQTIKPLKSLVGDVEDIAIINVLNAKLSNMITQTGVKFRQYENSNPATLSYYGINFMNSGTNKDYMVDCINDYLIPFVESELESKIEEYKCQYRQEQQLKRTGKKQLEMIEREIDEIRVANNELYNPNYTGLYKEAEQIHKMEFGSLFIRIGELGDYLDNIVSGNQSKKELYQKLKDIYEGTVAPSIIAGDSKRQTLKKIPVQALMYTDFENLLDPKVKKYYLKSLKTGIARRSFIYMPTDKHKKLGYPLRPKDKAIGINQLKQLQNEYYNLFTTLLNKQNKIYNISEDAGDLIYSYNCRCIDYFNNSKDDLIVKIEKKESFWKITKLAVIYSIIDNPMSNIVKPEYVEMAINFYEKIEPSLKAVINERELSDIEKIADYIYNNRDSIITRTDLRKTNIIKRDFKKNFDLMFEDIKEELLTTYNCYLLDYSGNKNLKAYQVKENV